MATQEVVVGKRYNVDHSRKGKFTLLVSGVDATWVVGTVAAGEARGILRDNDVGEGEQITLRRAHCVFTLVP